MKKVMSVSKHRQRRLLDVAVEDLYMMMILDTVLFVFNDKLILEFDLMVFVATNCTPII